jgi:orotidine-5'-phosphate decarboxylase
VAELIVALDLASGREALALAARLPGLRWGKIGPALYVREGPALVRELGARGIRVFLDLKWHDIPSSVAAAVTAAQELGVAMATLHTLGGPAMLAAAAAAAAGAASAPSGGPGGLALVGVTVLTSHSANEFERVVGRGVPDLGLEAERLGRLATEAGLAGVVASGQELGLLRAALGLGPWIVVPGIRGPGDAPGDQARTVAASTAVERGATHLVVGRPITRATDPVAVYQRLVESL